MCITPPCGTATPPSSASWAMNRLNIGSVGIQRSDSSITGRSTSRSWRTASSQSGCRRSATMVIPSCSSRWCPTRPRAGGTRTRGFLVVGEAVRHAVLVGHLRLHQHADQVVALLLASSGDDRRHDAQELPEPDPVGGDRGTDVERVPDRDAEAAGDGEQRDGGEHVDVEVGGALPLDPVEQRVDGALDPVLDPPARPLRQERRLHERAVPAVLGAVHVEDAGVEPAVGRLRDVGLTVAEHRVACREVERGEVRELGVRQPLEERVAVVADEPGPPLPRAPAPSPAAGGTQGTGRPRTHRHATARRCCGDRTGCGCARGRGRRTPTPWSRGALQHDDRDHPVGALLVLVVVRPVHGHELPQVVALGALRGACAHLVLVPFDLHLGIRFATRFLYQPGWSGAPPYDATTTTSSPRRSKISANLRGCPVLRPVVVSTRQVAPFHT